MRARERQADEESAVSLHAQPPEKPATAEQVFSTWPGVETDSAGLGADAEIPLSPEQIKWADAIFVMEKVHRRRLSAKFRRYLNGKRVICLDIPDEYEYMQPELVELLDEMNPEQLWEATMDLTVRRLLKVQIEGAMRRIRFSRR